MNKLTKHLLLEVAKDGKLLHQRNVSAVTARDCHNGITEALLPDWLFISSLKEIHADGLAVLSLQTLFSNN